MNKIGLIGFNKQEWPSLAKTLDFYIRSLTENFICVPILKTEDLCDELNCVIQFSGSLGWEICRKKHPKCPVIFIMHGGLILNHSFLSSNLKYLNSNDAVIVNCTSDELILNSLVLNVKVNCLVLHLPVDENVFYEIDTKLIRESTPFQNYDFIIGYNARILPQKNLHIFIDIFNTLKKKNKNKKIGALINGNFWTDYPVLPYYQNYHVLINSLIEKYNISGDIFFTSASLTADSLNVFYNTIDILVHPTNSLDENYGYVPVEAIKCGTPVIGSAYGGLKDTITHQKSGYLINTYCTLSGIRTNWLQFEFLLDELIRNPKSYLNLKYKTSQVAKSKYSYARANRGLLKFINQISSSTFNTKTDLKPLKFKTSSRIEFLPETNTLPWEYYYPVVKYYVSDNINVDIDLKEEVYIPYKIIKLDNKIQFEDSAWPASFEINKITKIILNECLNPISIKELLKKGVDKNNIYKYLLNGLIIINRTYER